MNDMALNRDVQNEVATATVSPGKAEPVAPKAVAAAAVETAPTTTVQRLVSLDAFRGLAMVLMVSAGLATTTVFKELSKDPGFAKSAHPYWEHWNYHTDHTAWTGCSLWDLIQPCFMFMVGAAVPFSIASRRAKGQGFGRMLVHATWRGAILTLLGVYIATNDRGTTRTNWEFTCVLAQIGLGYVFLFLLAWFKPRWQLVAAFTILVGYWLAFALYPAPRAGFDYGLLRADDLKQHPTGFAAHWDKNTNLGAAFDRWFLNQFPQQRASWPFVGLVPGLSESVHYWFPHRLFVANKGGYVTLNFVPSLVTMTFGLLAGGLLRRASLSAGWKILTLATAGAAGLGLGMLLDYTGICPSVKRIWTPSWTLLSAGWAFLGLAFFYLVCDVIRFRIWAMPLVVVGMNSIVIYLLSTNLKPWVRDTVGHHFGPDAFKNGARALFGGVQYEKMFEMSVFLLLLWLIAAWMYRRRIFIKV